MIPSTAPVNITKKVQIFSFFVQISITYYIPLLGVNLSKHGSSSQLFQDKCSKDENPTCLSSIEILLYIIDNIFDCHVIAENGPL